MRVERAQWALLLLAAVSAPAAANTKAGYDAWNKGDFHHAVELWRPDAIRGDADAQFDLGTAYKLGRGVPVDLAMAESWFSKAAAQGHVQAEDSLGLTLFQEGKLAEAGPWLEKSAARGEPRAQLLLGTMLFNGDGGLTRDYPRAYALVTRASGAGLPQAGQTLAEMDKYVSDADRGRGMELARKMAAEQVRPKLPPELAADASAPPPGTVHVAALPPSTYAEDRPTPAPSAAPSPTMRQSHPMIPASPPAPSRAAAGEWRVQFGAFRDENNARHLFEMLKGRVAAVAALQPYLVRAGALTKLQAGPLSSAAAAARTCAAVRPTATPCAPVRAE